MTSEGGPRHASPEPAEPAEEYGSPPPWPGPAANEPWSGSTSSESTGRTGAVRATASVPVPTSAPPGPSPQSPHLRYDQPTGSLADYAREARQQAPAGRVPSQAGPQGQAPGMSTGQVYGSGEATGVARARAAVSPGAAGSGAAGPGPGHPGDVPQAHAGFAPPPPDATPGGTVPGGTVPRGGTPPQGVPLPPGGFPMPQAGSAPPPGPHAGPHAGSGPHAGGGPRAGFAPPQAPGAGTSTGIPVGASAGGPAAGPGTGAEGRRATGTAHVPEVALLPAHQLPSLPKPVPRVYGNPALHTANPAAFVTPQSPPAPPVAARASAPAYGSAAPGAPARPQVPNWAHSVDAPAGPPTGPPSLPIPTSPGPGGPAEWRGTGEPEERPTEAAGSHVGLLIAVGVVVLLAVIGLTAYMWPRTNGGPQFAVNSCVKQIDNTAEAVDCTAAGAYRVVSRVDNRDLCPDAKQPYVELSEGDNPILCLAPANAPQVPNPNTT